MPATRTRPQPFITGKLSHSKFCSQQESPSIERQFLTATTAASTKAQSDMYQNAHEAWQSQGPDTTATPGDTSRAPCWTIPNGDDQTAESDPVPLEPPLAPFQPPSGSNDPPHGRQNTQMFSPQANGDRGLNGDWAAQMDRGNGGWFSPTLSFPDELCPSYPTTPVEACSALLTSQASTTGYFEFDGVGMGGWTDLSPGSESDMYWGPDQPDATMQYSSYIDTFQPNHHATMHPYSAVGGAADHHQHDHHDHRRAQSTIRERDSDDTQSLRRAEGTVGQSPRTGPRGSETRETSCLVVEKERRKRGRPRLYLKDGTRAAGVGLSRQQQHTTVASPTGNGPLKHPPLDSVAVDGTAWTSTAAGEISHTNLASSSRETPLSPTTGAPSRPRVPELPGLDKAAHTRARNRVAATRYRIRTQTNIAKAEEEEHEAEFQRNAQLACVDQLREEVFQLKSELLEHASCGCPLIRGYLSDVLYGLAAVEEPPEHSEHSDHPKSSDNSRNLQALCQLHQAYHQPSP